MDDFEKPVVLIVDDVPINIQVLAEALKSDYRIRVASSGEDALRMALRPPLPDLILLDVMMPDMDGYEVCRRLKDDPASQGIPVIFVTARDDAADEERGLQLGAIDYIAKPFRLPIVRARVRNHILLKQKNDMLERLALVDGLTGIPNRRNFDQRFAGEWRRASRDAQSLALVMADIDHFKQYNDHYGHGMGDTCLRRVARTLQNSLTRPADLVARYGGEEFIALLPETGLEGAREVAERMRQQVEALNLPHDYSSTAKVITVSLGYAAVALPAGSQSPEWLLQKVDESLYLAKAQGRNCVSTALNPPADRPFPLES